MKQFSYSYKCIRSQDMADTTGNTEEVIVTVSGIIEAKAYWMAAKILADLSEEDNPIDRSIQLTEISVTAELRLTETEESKIGYMNTILIALLALAVFLVCRWLAPKW